MQLLTWDDLAQMLRLSKRSVHRLKTSDPDFPQVVMVNKSPRFKQSDVNAYIDLLAKRGQEEVQDG